MQKDGFTSKIGFVLAAAGSAVGLGNIWRFPYLAAQHGGGIFLFTYLVLVLTFGYALLANNIYYDTLGIVRQNTKPMSVMSTSLRKDFQVGKLHFENRALFQLSSDKDVMPLPMLALNLRYYFEFDVVKNVMQMQIGADGRSYNVIGLGSCTDK